MNANDLGLDTASPGYRELVAQRANHADFLDAAYFIPAMPGRGSMDDAQRLSLRVLLAEEIAQLAADAS